MCIKTNNTHLFILWCICLCKSFVGTWLTENMSAFLDDPEAQKLTHVHNLHFNTRTQQLKLCTHSCDDCFLRCFQTLGHEQEEHQCLTDHKCKQTCEFCPRSMGKQCGEAAGHPGKHTCGSSEHTCGAKCDLADETWNCGLKCQLLPGHEGQHICGTTTHYCGHKCALEQCQEQCSYPYDFEHSRHQCSSTGCPIPCLLCNQKCSSSDHFHAETEDAIHLCSNEHACVDINDGTDGGVNNNANFKPVNQCSHQGWCDIRSELKREQRTFHGKHGGFEYDHVTDQVVLRHHCVIKIPAGQLKHEGPCAHSTDPSVIHYCGEPCSACKYRCTLPFGHTGRHSTQHGNMRNAFFVADKDDIDIGDRKYARSESGEAETCDSFCVKMGRGHVHTIRCDPKQCQNIANSEHRHAETKYSDGQGTEYDLDELTHEGYFEYINFKDPCLPEHQLEFKKCRAKCGSQAHTSEKNADGTPKFIYCEQPLWHEPLKQGEPLPNGCATGYISQQGHFFPCVHGRFSTYLIIDRSYSMVDDDAIPTFPQIINYGNLNNRVGAVYEAAIKYIKLRHYSSPDDIVTFVPFDNEAEVIFQGLSVTQQDEIINQMLPHGPRGGTSFVAGFTAAYNALQSERQQNTGQIPRKPVFILLTDSGAADRSETVTFLKSIMAQEQGGGPDLCIHALGIGEETDLNFLAEIAEIGNGSAYQINGENDVPMGLEAGDVFTLLAEQPDINVGVLTLY